MSRRRDDRAGSHARLHFVLAIIALCVRRGLLGRVYYASRNKCVRLVHQRLLRRFVLCSYSCRVYTSIEEVAI